MPSNRRRKSSTNRKHRRTEQPESQAFNPLAAERAMANIERLLAQHEFESLEEMQEFLNQVVAKGEQIEVEPETDAERAQELVYKAHDEPRRRKRVALARQALELDPNCAEAYVLLAELERTPQKASVYYAQGVEAGQRALGDEFEELRGEFWSFQETRGYMRAREGLASTLWVQGEHAAAIEHLEEMLELNPNDNQGVRYSLMNWLLEAGDLERAEKLYEPYKDDVMAAWRYSRALMLFLKEGPGRKSNRALREALDWNPFVVAYLLGMLPQPQPPAFMKAQDPTEAAGYLYEGGLTAWMAHTPALDWLVMQTEQNLDRLSDWTPEFP